ILGSMANFGDIRGRSLELSAVRDIILNFVTFVQSDGPGGSTTTAGRNITITGNSLINCNGGGAPNILTTGLNGVLTIDLSGSVNANNGNITLTTDDISLAGSIGTNASVTIRPVSVGRSVDLGSDT